jgi:hypothetical protein
MSKNLKFLFFNSSPGVVEFSQLEKSIMGMFAKNDFEIFRVSCSGTYRKFCTYMNSVDLDYGSNLMQKKIACKACNNVRLNLVSKSKESKYKISHLSDLI